MNNKKIITNRLLAVCIAALIGCWILKLCGGAVFDFVVKNEFLIKVCYNIENSIIKYIIYWMFYIFNCLMIIAIISKQKKFDSRNTFIFIGISTIVFSINFFLPALKTILDFILLPLLPIIFYRTKWWKAILFELAILVLQFALLQIRNIGYTLYFSNFIVGLLYQLDYYIMLVAIYIRRSI